MQSDHDILTAGDSLPAVSQYHAMDAKLKIAHAYAHSDYIQGTIGDPHFSFHDPFVFLLHSNVDRLWACWQRAPGQSWRLDPNQVYGIDGATPSINADLEPWSGGTHMIPWAPPENQQTPMTSKHASVVAAPAYDACVTTLLLSAADRWAAVIRVLFGVINDAPGVVWGPGGPQPVGPWGPMVLRLSQLSPAHQDMLLGMAINEIASLASSHQLRADGVRAGTAMMNAAVKSLQKSIGG
jgi:Common central domain of tyrosinase